MTIQDFPVGNLRRSSAALLAERAARHLYDLGPRARRALCVDPRGRVTLESVTAADTNDCVGVYVCNKSWLELAAFMAADLAPEKNT